MILKKLFAAMLMAAALPGHAIIWQYDSFNASKKTCCLTGWSGSQPSSGKLTLPGTYTHTDGVTYTVTAVGNHALDNLTEVKEITIPAQTRVIGGAEGGSFPTRLENFRNCPKLEKFNVDAANEIFSAIEGGVLFLKYENKAIICVPARLAVASGKLTLPSTVKRISYDAFRGNTTVSTLSIPRKVIVEGNGGLNYASRLQAYELSGTGTGLKLSGGVLLERFNEVVSMPAATTQTSVTLPSDITIIRPAAFRGTASLTSVKLPSVTTIGKDAFAGSGVRQITLPGMVKKIGDGVFHSCPNLEEIVLKASELLIPQDFARDCPALKRVTSDNPIGYINTAAFKNCARLTEFPFSAATDMFSDSIFYGCGFTEVVYDNLPAVNGFSESMFTACRNLERIDASAVVTGEESFGIGIDFAGMCPKLKEVVLPRFSSFWRNAYNEHTPPAFGYSCAVEKVVFHTFWSEEMQFSYSSGGGVRDFSPAVYVAVTEGSDVSTEWNSWPLEGMFSAANGATVSPRVFTDAYAPCEKYVDRQIQYYVPGGAAYNYDEAIEAGCQVAEMFDIVFANFDGNMRVTVSQNMRPAAVGVLSNISVQFDNGTLLPIGMGSSATSHGGYQSVKRVRVRYTLDGVEMATDYPAEHWLTSGVDEAAADASVPVAYTVFNLQGVAVASGSGASEVDTLAPGVYIIMERYADGSVRNTKVTL